MKWNHIRGGGKVEGGERSVLWLGLVSNNDGHRGYDYCMQEAGGGTLHGDHGEVFLIQK